MKAAGLLMLALAAALAAGPASAQGELGDVLPGTIRSAVGDLAALREIDAIDQLVADVKTACKTLKGYDRPALQAFYQGMMSAQEEAAKRSLLAQEEQALYYERRRAEYVRYYANAMTPCVLQRIDELNAPEPTVAAKPPAAGTAKPPALTAAAKPPATPPSPVAAKPPANPPVEIASTAPAPSAPAEVAATKPPAAPAETSPPAPAKPAAAAKPPASPPPTPIETAASAPPAAAPSAPAPAAAKALPAKPSVAAANPPPAPAETSAAPALAAPAEVATVPASPAVAAPEAPTAQPNAEPAEPLPDNITVTDYNVKNGTATIVLSKIKDNIYGGTWDKGGFKSRMTVSVFTPNRLVLRRQDFGGDGVGKGMTYAGKRDGNRVDATGYKFPDPLGLGTWEAKW